MKITPLIPSDNSGYNSNDAEGGVLIWTRFCITELREKRGISEHRLSLELGKSGSYIRSITSGATMPSVKELFNIILYFEMSPADFFVGTEGKDTLRTIVTKQLHELSDDELEKVSQFIGWIQK